MNRHDLSNLYAFVAVAEHGSFSRAAEQLATAPSSISQTIRNLEDRLGVLLFNRNTRSVALTPAGELLLERIKPLLSEMQQTLEEVHFYGERPLGLIRVHTSRLGWHDHLEPALPRFYESYPDVVLDVCIEDTVVELVANHFDVGIRPGDAIDQDMVAFQLAPAVREVAVASPLYVARYGKPGTPQELTLHNCLRWRIAGQSNPQRWTFINGKKLSDMTTTGSLIVNDRQVAVGAAIVGLGIALFPDYAVKDLIEAGKLVSLLDEYSAEYPGQHLCYPKQRRMSPALRAFIDLVKEHKRSNGAHCPWPDQRLAGCKVLTRR